MTTFVTFCILAAAGASWWLVRDIWWSARGSAGPKCPICGSRRTEPAGGKRRCIACGTVFRPRGPLHLREPSLPAVSVVLLAFLALLAFALSDLLLSWRIIGPARAGLVAAAATAGVAASIARILHARGQAGRN